MFSQVIFKAFPDRRYDDRHLIAVDEDEIEPKPASLDFYAIERA